MAVTPASSGEAVWRWSAVYDDTRKDLFVTIDSYTPGWYYTGWGGSNPVLHTDPARLGSNACSGWELSTDPNFTPGPNTRSVGSGGQPFYTGDPDMKPNEIYYLHVKIPVVGGGSSDWSPAKVIFTPSQYFVNVNGIWKPAIPFVKAGGTWHQAVMRTKQSGAWKS